jgi:hypothetical protein
MKNLNTIFKAVGLALGVAVVLLSFLGALSVSTGILLLAIGVTALGIASIQK